MSGIDGLHFKKYTTQQVFGNTDLLQVPAFLLDADDIAILLGAEEQSQVRLIKKALELVRIFNSSDSNAQAYKDNIIARTCLDILSSGRTPGQIRDKMISVLTDYNTSSLNLDSMIHQPGYDRTIKQCLEIDDQGKINSLNLVIDFLQERTKPTGDGIKTDDTITYGLKDIYSALDFAIISQGSYLSQETQDNNINLKARLNNIINSDNAKFFEYSNYVSKKEYVEEFFKTTDSLGNAQLVDVNISCLDDKIAKSIIKILSKLFFKYTTEVEKLGSYPIHILIEEAQRYVQDDNDTKIIGYNIFDKITKEGTKYGTIIGLISQRANELSRSSLSQCANFIVYKLFNPDDLNIIKGISLNISDDSFNKIKTLRPGMGMVFGTAFKVPLLVNFPLPNPLPTSPDIRIDTVWYGDNEEKVDDNVADVTRVQGTSFISTIDQEENTENENTENENTTE